MGVQNNFERLKELSPLRVYQVPLNKAKSFSFFFYKITLADDTLNDMNFAILSTPLYNTCVREYCKI